MPTMSEELGRSAATEINNGVRVTVNVRTTGLCGGDAGHGGRTEVRMHFDGADVRVRWDEDRNLTIDARGDLEVLALTDALEFAAKSLQLLLDQS